MAIKEGIRTGGRSARVQQSVHAAVRALLQEQDRASLTVPLIAARAGVTPSTIYRRWSELAALLADVALERLRPDGEPADTGSLRGDLLAWAEQYLDEMSSEVGRNMMRDVISSACPGYCTRILRGQLQVILDRAEARAEALPDLDRLLDLLVAPTVFRILFAEAPPSAQQLPALVDLALA
ncbi:TetR/AcrR family transcriptional regulator [Pseudomonas sp. SBB6]|uniref:TetR/AcrR family transcriptional regulator n=1 Tax=Pseudomonas sp. SBB6 TaxID=2962032 RepID=UPI0020B899C7|nr:TetR/AcrR family transcriptional regulator [Pseudomonas sp. SBB6]MCP3752204.1 TetR/AcrR family transcriptional regulator [Pseudomonas sp. SBB6]